MVHRPVRSTAHPGLTHAAAGTPPQAGHANERQRPRIVLSVAARRCCANYTAVHIDPSRPLCDKVKAAAGPPRNEAAVGASSVLREFYRRRDGKAAGLRQRGVPCLRRRHPSPARHRPRCGGDDGRCRGRDAGDDDPHATDDAADRGRRPRPGAATIPGGAAVLSHVEASQPPARVRLRAGSRHAARDARDGDEPGDVGQVAQ